MRLASSLLLLALALPTVACEPLTDCSADCVDLLYLPFDAASGELPAGTYEITLEINDQTLEVTCATAAEGPSAWTCEEDEVAEGSLAVFADDDPIDGGAFELTVEGGFGRETPTDVKVTVVEGSSTLLEQTYSIDFGDAQDIEEGCTSCVSHTQPIEL